jgi:hypothetical protein
VLGVFIYVGFSESQETEPMAYSAGSSDERRQRLVPRQLLIPKPTAFPNILRTVILVVSFIKVHSPIFNIKYNMTKNQINAKLIDFL